MTTKRFLARYAYVYLYILCFFLLCAAGLRSAAEAVDSDLTVSAGQTIIIDAGHGGIDSGTTSCTGVAEKEINLQIARRLDKLLKLMGYDTVMVRTTGESIATEGETIRQQKQSDLRNRVNIANSHPEGILVSIHQNHYSDSRYWGPQIFYREDQSSRELAQKLQTALNQAVNPGNNRTAKQAENVYLMKNIQCVGLLVECGFLSNPEEEARLRNSDYQKMLCSVISSVLAGYLSEDTEPGVF